MGLNVKKLVSGSMICLSVGLVACQKQESPKVVAEADKTSPVSASEQPKQEQILPAIWAKPYRMDIPQQEICHPETQDEVAACTIYDLQSIKSNVDWIAQYYADAIKSDYAQAFEIAQSQGPVVDNKYYEGTSVAFINQRYNLVTFTRFTNAYSGGAHNIFHSQYDVFDLKSKKKLTLDDVLKPNAKAKVLALLKEQNADKLKEYGTDLNELTVSSNFYFGEYGLVFVYGLYEIAPFASGMPELYLSHDTFKDVLKSEYVPELPDMSLSQEFS